MDDISKSDTIPFNEIHNSQVALEHEAKVSKISEEQLYYLMSRGLTEKEATDMIVMGFIEPFTERTPNGVCSRTQPIDFLQHGGFNRIKKKHSFFPIETALRHLV